MSKPTPTSNSKHDHTGTMIETSFLIVGAGPAGASLACFLASYGLHGIMISASSGTAKEPRAHITNPAAQECLRDIGLEEEILRDATVGENMQYTLYCHDMLGQEYARIGAWGNKVDRTAEYRDASPCKHVDLPQTLLEPILVRYATNHKWTVRFDTEFLEFHRDDKWGLVTSTIKDLVTGSVYSIRSKYLFGCDGGRSRIARQLNLPRIKRPGQGLATNILTELDLGDAIKHRKGNLHWILQPDIETPSWGGPCIVRMVKPWHEWMFIMVAEPGYEDKGEVTVAEYEKRVRQMIGSDTVPFKIIDTSKWNINEVVSANYSDGNIYTAGDAAHIHPPFNGLGSNTCIQDAYNLAWKIAYVERGWAQPALLETYNLERQPIGAGVVQRANQGLRDHLPVWEALGLLEKDLEERKRQFAELAAPTAAGRARRAKFATGIKLTEHEYGGIGVEMNQQYQSSAIYTSDQGTRADLPADPVLTYQISTYPGSRLPHAWLNRTIPINAPVSTHDLAGHGSFCLFTGIGGDEWKVAASWVGDQKGIHVNAYSIGWQQDWEDPEGEWGRKCEVEEDGCVLVRPDRVVCWRSVDMKENCREVLIRVLEQVLSRA